MYNCQKPEKYHRTDGRVLHVQKIFPTIQGEGPFTGQAATFIRLAGCNLQCPLCDTDYTSNRRVLSVANICEEVQLCTNDTTRLIVITGGEPFRQQLSPLLSALIENGYYIQIETNGTLTPAASCHYNTLVQEKRGVYVVCSPKAGNVKKAIWEVACCAKYVIDHMHVASDLLPRLALMHPAHPQVARPIKPIPIYVQPTDYSKVPLYSQEEKEYHYRESQKVCIQGVLTRGYIYQQQLHKELGME